MWRFQSLGTYTGEIRQRPIDPSFHRADLARSGVEPTVWLFEHSTPPRLRWPRLAHGS